MFSLAGILMVSLVMGLPRIIGKQQLIQDTMTAYFDLNQLRYKAIASDEGANTVMNGTRLGFTPFGTTQYSGTAVIGSVYGQRRVSVGVGYGKVSLQ